MKGTLNRMRGYLAGSGALRAFAGVIALAMTAAMPLSNSLAAGMQSGGGQQGGDEVRDQLQLRDGSCCTTPTVVELLAGDQDQDQDRLQLRDGSCDNDCDGVPDQDRDRIGQN